MKKATVFDIIPGNKVIYKGGIYKVLPSFETKLVEEWGGIKLEDTKTHETIVIPLNKIYVL